MVRDLQKSFSIIDKESNDWEKTVQVVGKRKVIASFIQIGEEQESIKQMLAWVLYWAPEHPLFLLILFDTYPCAF